MKPFLKGILLALSLMICCRVLHVIFMASHPLAFLIYFAVTAAFLVSKKISHLFLCGFTGLFTLIIFEIGAVVLSVAPESQIYFLMIHYIGMHGSFLAILPGIAITVVKPKIHLLEECHMSHSLKIKMLLYGAVTACTFTLFAAPERAGISVPLFVLIQAVCLWFLVPDKKRLFMLIPIGIFSLNCFFSAANIWRFANFIISMILLSSMFLNFSFFSRSIRYLFEMVRRFFAPFTAFALPFRWVSELSSGKAHMMKRIVLALLLTIPCALLLVLVLSSADMVFSLKTVNILKHLTNGFDLHILWLILFGVLVGLYAFGCLYVSHAGISLPVKEKKVVRCDLIIINTFLAVILAVYTMFVIIQFRYLFAGNVLPDGLSYTEYARKGFFELLALTGVNIFLILCVMHLTSETEGSWCKVTRLLCHYLCAVTIVLLVSSFYRMYLYTADDGLTRLRFFVMGFLVFEAIGLLITFVYIAKPKFNITGVYLILALFYYCLLNLIPTDNIIARNQIDKYISGQRESVDYVFTLSADAAPAMETLYTKTDDPSLQPRIITFFRRKNCFEYSKAVATL